MEGVAETPWQCGDPLEYQGYDYETVQIGEQCWFAENLRAENYGNGDAIPAGLSDSEWDDTTSGAITYYGATLTNCSNSSPSINSCDSIQVLSEYGRLYNGYAVTDSRGLCPSGWHVSTDEEWQTLESFLGMPSYEVGTVNLTLLNEFATGGGRGEDTSIGVQLKSSFGWNFGSGSNASGFAGFPGSCRLRNGSTFYSAGWWGFWWSPATELESTHQRLRMLFAERDGIDRGNTSPNFGLSVRCVKDSE